MPLPEYGRSIQNMVDYALTIQDRAERQRCANTMFLISSINCGTIWLLCPVLSWISIIPTK